MSRGTWTRREFLSVAATCGVCLASGTAPADPRLLQAMLGSADAGSGDAARLAELIRAAPEARFWVSTVTAASPGDCRPCHAAAGPVDDASHAHAEPLVRCGLCASNCEIAEGERGRCRARINVEGKLKSLVYGRPISVHVDPIEKKPFYHFLPGRAAFSLATSGCPLRCRFCQNWEISQARPEDYRSETIAPRRVVDAAVARRAPVIAFTYNEPTVFIEYLLDIARAARERGRRSVLVSCGFMNEAPLAEMCESLDAIKIDLKGYSEDFYRKICDAELRPVLRSIRQVARSSVHLEIVNLVVPTLNDSPRMLTELVKWIAGEIGPDVPLHFTRFHPDYQLLHLSPTPVATLERAREIAVEHGLRYAYVGNVPGHPGNHTVCPGCGERVIERRGFLVAAMRMSGGRCRECGHPIAGVWS